MLSDPSGRKTLEGVNLATPLTLIPYMPLSTFKYTLPSGDSPELRLFRFETGFKADELLNIRTERQGLPKMALSVNLTWGFDPVTERLTVLGGDAKLGVVPGLTISGGAYKDIQRPPDVTFGDAGQINQTDEEHSRRAQAGPDSGRARHGHGRPAEVQARRTEAAAPEHLPMSAATVRQSAVSRAAAPPAATAVRLQRRCACGQHAHGEEECASCRQAAGAASIDERRRDRRRHRRWCTTCCERPDTRSIARPARSWSRDSGTTSATSGFTPMRRRPSRRARSARWPIPSVRTSSSAPVSLRPGPHRAVTCSPMSSRTSWSRPAAVQLRPCRSGWPSTATTRRRSATRIAWRIASRAQAASKGPRRRPLARLRRASRGAPLP